MYKLYMTDFVSMHFPKSDHLATLLLLAVIALWMHTWKIKNNYFQYMYVASELANCVAT